MAFLTNPSFSQENIKYLVIEKDEENFCLYLDGEKFNGQATCSAKTLFVNFKNKEDTKLDGITIKINACEKRGDIENLHGKVVDIEWIKHNERTKTSNRIVLNNFEDLCFVLKNETGYLLIKGSRIHSAH